jgi:hypothetical protein
LTEPQQIEQTEPPRKPRRVVGSRARRGRPRGSRNKPGHHAGRPRKPSEEFDETLWQNGRRRISVEDPHIAQALQRSSSACAIAEAVKQQIPNAIHVSVDLATIRWTDRVKQLRYVALTPMCAQELIVNFDQGLREKLQPISFDLKPVMISRAGAKRRQVPEASELRGSGISPAPPADPQEAKPKLIPYAGKEKRTVSKVKPDGTVPVVLGGRMPPISALPSNQRAFGLRQARR